MKRLPKLGSICTCERHGDHPVVGHTADGWPLIAPTKNIPVPAIYGELSEAIRTASVASICERWGVCRYTVYRWRKHFGVPRMNAGTRKLWSDLAPVRLTQKSRLKGNRASARAAKKRAATAKKQG